MKNFSNRIAVVTGGGTGMGRELVIALAAEGCHVGMCDVSADNMAETRRLAQVKAPAGVRITTHLCDVSSEQQMQAFRDAVCAEHATDHINLLFNNAGIGGGGGFVAGDRELWERTFGVCWYGVYYGCRTFLPLLVASEEGHVVNTSSVNGFWASIGPGVEHTAYCAAKFAVKGFTEALITDLAMNAPHVHASVVMPGHIGTSIALNTSTVLGQRGALEMTAAEVDAVRQRMVARGLPVGNLPDEQIRAAMHQRAIDFRDKAPTTAAQAANIILDGVRAQRWRILVGDDAVRLDRMVREDPENAYTVDFMRRVWGEGLLGGLTQAPEQAR
ncbi:MAG: SDR family NAD(P)-dependent oxidoreductase [Pseudomonadales bacterium]|nr:SDR family NAD(P)-dependent oxidoreductase [Pseudomonadales bacterium]MCP5185443.1 SDR family NAD(P)-dependent oxidoreductase [Pseudomonadales bacterium]